MKAQKDPKTGKWFIQYRFTDWQGNRRKSTKRGFDTKRDAEAWLTKFLQKNKADFDMPFEEFVKLYLEDMGNRLRATTLDNKRYIIDDKVLPYFGRKRVNDILNNGQVSALISFMRNFVYELGAVILLPILFGIDGIFLDTFFSFLTDF